MDCASTTDYLGRTWLTLFAVLIDSPMDTVEDFVDLSEAIAALAVSTYTGMISTLTTKVLRVFSPIAGTDFFLITSVVICQFAKRYPRGGG